MTTIASSGLPWTRPALHDLVDATLAEKLRGRRYPLASIGARVRPSSTPCNELTLSVRRLAALTYTPATKISHPGSALRPAAVFRHCYRNPSIALDWSRTDSLPENEPAAATESLITDIQSLLLFLQRGSHNFVVGIQANDPILLAQQLYQRQFDAGLLSSLPVCDSA